MRIEIANEIRHGHHFQFDYWGSQNNKYFGICLTLNSIIYCIKNHLLNHMDKLRGSRLNRSNTTLTGSFKMSESVLGGGGGNRKVFNLKVPNIKIIGKQSYKKQEQCQVCFITFSTLNRQHHCRVCANAVCTTCSISSINKQRACDVCAYHHSQPEKSMAKLKILQQLKGIATLYVQNKREMQQELKTLNQELSDSSMIQKLQRQSNQRLQELDKQLQKAKKERQQIQNQIGQLQQAD